MRRETGDISNAISIKKYTVILIVDIIAAVAGQGDWEQVRPV